MGATGGYFTNDIVYTISNGYPNFTIELLNSDKPVQQHTGFGTYQFTNVNYGTYILKIVDSKDCILEIPIELVNTNTGVTCNLNAIINSPSAGEILVTNVQLSSGNSTNYATINILNELNVIVYSKLHTGNTTTFYNIPGGNYTVCVVDPDSLDCKFEQPITVLSILNFIPTAFNIGEE